MIFFFECDVLGDGVGGDCEESKEEKGVVSYRFDFRVW